MSKTVHSRPCKALQIMPGKGVVRFDALGRITSLASADNYVMVRRHHAVPFVVDLAKWYSYSPVPLDKE